MDLYFGWEGDKFVMVVMEGHKILHRISCTDKEMIEIVDCFYTNKGGGMSKLPNHQQLR